MMLDEQLVQKIVKQVIADLLVAEDSNVIPVELSARHIHLCQADVDQLFGGTLTNDRPLSQPGQFLCKEKVRLIGPRGIIDRVAVLGPVRKESQVEISMTDARSLGIESPLRQSGDITDTPGIVLASSKGIVSLREGVIVAGRHIHMPTGDAQRFGVVDGEKVSVHVKGQRPVIMEDVLVRVNDNFKLAMHIDLDEGNGCGCMNGTPTVIIENK